MVVADESGTFQVSQLAIDVNDVGRRFATAPATDRADGADRVLGRQRPRQGWTRFSSVGATLNVGGSPRSRVRRHAELDEPTDRQRPHSPAPAVAAGDSIEFAAPPISTVEAH